MPPEPVFPVGLDEDALTEDLERLSAGAENALREFREELKALRGEVRELRRANDILKSASAFFAAELDPRRTK